MKNEVLNEYLINGKLDIDKIIDDFYGYVYIIVKNGVSIFITDEDIEEIVSDVFVAIWKNSNKLSNTIALKTYLAEIAKNVVKTRNNITFFKIIKYDKI